MKDTYILNFSGNEKYNVVKDQMTYSVTTTNPYNEMSVKLFINDKELTTNDLEFLTVYVIVDLTDTQRWYELMSIIYKLSHNGTININILCDKLMTANQLFFAKKILYNLCSSIKFATTNDDNVAMEVLSIEFLKSYIELKDI